MEGGFWPAGWLSYPVGEAVGVLFFFFARMVKIWLGEWDEEAIGDVLTTQLFFVCLHA